MSSDSSLKTRDKQRKRSVAGVILSVNSSLLRVRIKQRCQELKSGRREFSYFLIPLFYLTAFGCLPIDSHLWQCLVVDSFESLPPFAQPAT